MITHASGGGVPLERIAISALHDFPTADCTAAFAAFHRLAMTSRGDHGPLRPALPADAALKAAQAHALVLGPGVTGQAAREFFLRRFTPHRVNEEAFFTGYYEPVVEGALERSPAFTAPLLGRPPDLRTFAANDPRPDWASGLSAAQAMPDGSLHPYPDRAAIEASAVAGGYAPVVWLRDWVEAFLIQVQGSARVDLPDGRTLRLTYAGRNGHPYTSIGRILVERGDITAEAMSLERLKAWLRDKGQEPGEAGRTVMQANASYVFFDAAIDASLAGPIGGAGLPLTPLVSIAVDRTRWPYGMPFWIDATLPWAGEQPTQLRRIMIAEDTGSAIVGPARVDLFLGRGETAGRLAGGIRHRGTLTVLLPRAGDP